MEKKLPHDTETQRVLLDTFDTTLSESNFGPKIPEEQKKDISLLERIPDFFSHCIKKLLGKSE